MLPLCVLFEHMKLETYEWLMPTFLDHNPNQPAKTPDQLTVGIPHLRGGSIKIAQIRHYGTNL